MDKTLADYIARTMARLETEQQKIQNNKNIQNDSKLAEQDYLVYPEKQNIDSDEKINPYSRV